MLGLNYFPGEFFKIFTKSYKTQDTKEDLEIAQENLFNLSGLQENKQQNLLT